MADVEVPDPKDAEEKAADPFTRQIALCVAVYAVALAVTALGGSNAGKDMVMAQQQASNQWAYYQAKVMRENMYVLAAENLELDIEEAGDKSKAKELREKKLANYRKKAEEYKAEKEEIAAEAKKLEAERDVARPPRPVLRLRRSAAPDRDRAGVRRDAVRQAVGVLRQPRVRGRGRAPVSQRLRPVPETAGAGMKTEIRRG